MVVLRRFLGLLDGIVDDQEQISDRFGETRLFLNGRGAAIVSFRRVEKA